MKQIKNFERYYIDRNGVIYDSKRGMKEICQWIDNVGYKQCVLRNNDNKKCFKRVHRLVAETFISNKYNLPQVNHIDGDKTNNNVDNLEWVSNRENTQHGYDNGLYKFKTRCYPVDVYDRNNKFINTYKSIRNLSETLHLNRKTVSAILNNKKTNNYNYIFKYHIN